MASAAVAARAGRHNLPKMCSSGLAGERECRRKNSSIPPAAPMAGRPAYASAASKLRTMPRGVLGAARDLVSLRRRTGIHRPRGARPRCGRPQQRHDGARPAGDPLAAHRPRRPGAGIPDHHRSRMPRRNCGWMPTRWPMHSRRASVPMAGTCDRTAAAEGETPIAGSFVKQRCRKMADGQADGGGKPPLLQVRTGIARSQHRPARP